MTTAIDITLAPAVPRIVPTVSQPVRIAWNDWAEQLLVHEQTIIEGLAEAGTDLALSTVPMGSLIANFVGPTVVKQTVDQGLLALEGLLSNPDLAITISPTNFLATFVANTINTTGPALAKQLGPTLDPMIASAVAKALPAPAAPASPSAPAIETGR